MAEKTFKGYTLEQAKLYRIERGSYPSELYQEILAYHENNHGKWHKFLDIGCGPGKSTHDLARFFDTAIGVDHSEQMIQEARSVGYQSKIGPVRFEVSGAEDFDALEGISSDSIDLITAGMAAHWFDMDRFWKIAGRSLAPGGTVALWTCSSLFCHPDTPNASTVQEILFDLENNILGKYALPGNLLSQNMYDHLTLPWDSDPDQRTFDQRLYIRKQWNRDGKLEPGKADFVIKFTTTLYEIRENKSTASMYTRWAEANPELVGTEKDCMREQARRIQEATGLGDHDNIMMGCGLALLLFTKT